MIRPQFRYPGQTDTGDAGFPHGKARNATTLNDGTGFPIERDWVNDVLGAKQALIEEAGLTPSDEPDRVGASQELEALDVLFYRKAIIDAIEGRTDVLEAIVATSESTLFTGTVTSSLSGISAVNSGNDAIIATRRGNHVQASAHFEVTNSVTGDKSFEFTLPYMVGDFSQQFHLSGHGAAFDAAGGVTAQVFAVTGTQRARVEWQNALVAGNTPLRLTFGYYIGTP